MPGRGKVVYYNGGGGGGDFGDCGETFAGAIFRMGLTYHTPLSNMGVFACFATEALPNSN